MKRRFFMSVAVLCCFAASFLQAAVMPYSNYITPDGRPLIVPEVSSYKTADGTLKLPAEFTVSVQKGEELIIEQFAADLKKFPEIKVSAAENGFCRFILTDKNVPENKEGYTVTVNKKGITVKGRTKTALYYGAQTLRNIFRNAAAAEIGCCRITDEPDFALRGYTFDLRRSPDKTANAAKKCIDALSALKINTLFLCLGYTFPFKENPFPDRPKAYTREEIADLIDYCNRRHIQVIPTLQVMSHTAWMTGHPNWDKIKEGVPNKNWNSAPCPQNQEGRDLVAMALNEHIDLFKSEFFYIVYDELFLCPFRQCPKCKKVEAKKLLKDYLDFVIGILNKRNVRPIVCQDSFISKGNLWPWGDWFRDQLPANTVIRWWNYQDKLFDKDVAPFSKFTLLGNAVCGKPLNTYNMAHIIKKFNGYGSCMTYWYYSTSGMFSNLIQETPDSLGGIVNGAGYYWRLTRQPYPDITYDGTLEMMRIMYPEQLNLPPRNGKVSPVPLTYVANAELSGSGKFPRFDSDAQIIELKKALAALPERFRLMTAPGGKYYALRVSGNNLGRVGVLVKFHNRKFDMLSMLLTASRPQNGMDYFSGTNVYGPKRFKYEPAATVTIRYADKTKVRIPLRYRRDITDWNRPFGGFNMRWAVRGLDADKKYYSFGIYDLKNPHPEKEVAGVSFGTSRLDNISPALLAISAWGMDKPFSMKTGKINDAIIAKRSGVPADPKPPMNVAYDFEKDMGRLEVTAPDKLKKAMKVEIVEDATSPSGSKVLKISVPAGKYKGRESDQGYLRISLDMPYTIKPKTWSIAADIKLKAAAGDFSHVNNYLVNSEVLSPRRKYFVTSRLPVRPDGRWTTIISAIRKVRQNGTLQNVNQTKVRRISFFFKSFNGPMELYVDNIGDTTVNISAAPIWKEGTEAEPY